MRKTLNFLTLSLATLPATPSLAEGVGIVLDYYEMAFDHLIQAGDQAASLEFNRLVSDIGTRTELIQNDIGYSASGNTNYVKTIVDGILGDNPEYYTGGRGYLYNWGKVSDGLKSVNSAKGVIDIAGTLKDIGVKSSKFNDAAKEIAALTARGDSNAVSWLFAVAEAGYYGGSAQLDLLGLSDDTKETLEDIFSNASSADIERVASALRQDAAAYSSNEYRNLMLDEDGKRVIVQQLVIQYLSKTTPGVLSGLPNQNLYSVQFVDRLWPIRNTYTGSVVPGSSLFQDFDFQGGVSYVSPWNPPLTEVTEPSSPIALAGSTTSQPLTPQFERAPDYTDDRQAEIIEEAQPVDPPTTATWAGRMSLSGRYTIGLNPATGVVEAMEASGDAPVNNFILFNPDAGTISQPLRGVQTTAGIGHSFNHLIWGNWSGGSRVWEDNSDQPVAELSGFFVYGELTPATSRTSGSATYTGRLRGDVIEEGGAIHRGLAYGDFGLTANFGTGALGGWLAIAGEDSTDYVFVTDITDARIVRQNDRLAFYGDLGSNYDDASGSIEGYFYGANATELGGTYEVTNTNGEGSSHGILLGWETGTMPERPADPEDSLAIIVGYDSSANSHGTAWSEGNATGSVISYNDSSDTIESVTKTTTFAAGGYSYVSWGSWAANDTTREELGPNGTWVDVTSVTPSSVIASKTGTAEYSGNIAGGYVSYGGIREDARGLINITADFSDQSVSGEFQFGRGCGGSGSGPSGCNTISRVETFDEPINDYGGSGFGDHTGGLSGVVGVFGGPNGEEIGGTAWLTEDNGQYIGVFRAGQ